MEVPPCGLAEQFLEPSSFSFLPGLWMSEAALLDSEPCSARLSAADDAPPAKWPRDNSKGQGNKPGKGTSGHSWQGGQDWWSEGQQVKQLKAEVAYLRENMQLLARMALRHEDELVQMRFEKEFLISMDVGEHGILNTMYAASLTSKKHSTASRLPPPRSATTCSRP